MADGIAMNARSSETGLLDAQAEQLLQRTRSLGKTDKAVEDAKIDKSARDFESILLGSWLQQAEQSFATVPGGGGEDEDTGKDQFQSIAMQALAGSLTRSGGIGIAKMIAQHLHASSEHEANRAIQEPKKAG